MEEFVAAYDPAPTEQRVQRWRGYLRSRLIGLVLLVLVAVVVGIWQRNNVSLSALIGGYVVVFVLSVAAVAVLYLIYRRALRARTTLADGAALRIDRRGVRLAGTAASWPEITSFAVRRGPVGLSPWLELVGAGGTVRLPLDQVDAAPASIDSAARAFSAGRRGLDLSELDA